MSELLIRPARPGDEGGVFELIRELAVYEKLEHRVSGSAEQLAEHLFGARPVAEALVAERGGELIGFALFFTNYSTFLTRPGLFLEDLFVRESERRGGVGRALLSAVIQVARERGAGRLDWAVLDWNQSAIAFYERMGAELLSDWRLCRLTP